MKNLWIALSAVIITFLNVPCQAEENMKFHGMLIKAPDCHINDDKVIEVKFGNIGINKIDGTLYAKGIDYKVTCDGNSDEHLYLSVDGTSVVWDDAAVKASADNLAIEIRQNGRPFPLGSSLRIDLNALPILTAVPVKDSGHTLTAGEFTAAATLVAFYQ